MTRHTMVPDWGRVIEELDRAGCGAGILSKAMESQITDRMIRYYRDGMQPAWWRGQKLLELWAQTLGREIADVPLIALRRGYRAQGSHVSAGPRVQALPQQWPLPVSGRPGKRKRRSE